MGRAIRVGLVAAGCGGIWNSERRDVRAGAAAQAPGAGRGCRRRRPTTRRILTTRLKAGRSCPKAASGARQAPLTSTRTGSRSGSASVVARVRIPTAARASRPIPAGMRQPARCRTSIRSCKFDSTGKLVKSFGAGMMVFPHGIHVDRDGNIWVTDGNDNLPRRRPGQPADAPLPRDAGEGGRPPGVQVQPRWQSCC